MTSLNPSESMSVEETIRHLRQFLVCGAAGGFVGAVIGLCFASWLLSINLGLSYLQAFANAYSQTGVAVVFVTAGAGAGLFLKYRYELRRC